MVPQQSLTISAGHAQAIVIASQASDAFIQAANRDGRAVMYDAEGRNAVSHAALMALERIDPGRWQVATTDLNDARQARLLVTCRDVERVTLAMSGANKFQPKHGTAERWGICDCLECSQARWADMWPERWALQQSVGGRHPTAPALRRELAALLKAAADKADEWCKAAQDEWAPLAPDYHAGNGDITAAIEGPYIEHRLAMGVGSDIRRMFDHLDPDTPTVRTDSPLHSTPLHPGSEWT